RKFGRWEFRGGGKRLPFPPPRNFGFPIDCTRRGWVLHPLVGTASHTGTSLRRSLGDKRFPFWRSGFLLSPLSQSSLLGISQARPSVSTGGSRAAAHFSAALEALGFCGSPSPASSIERLFISRRSSQAPVFSTCFTMAKFRASLLASSNQSSFSTTASVPPAAPAGAVPPASLGLVGRPPTAPASQSPSRAAPVASGPGLDDLVTRIRAELPFGSGTQGASDGSAHASQEGDLPGYPSGAPAATSDVGASGSVNPRASRAHPPTSELTSAPALHPLSALEDIDEYSGSEYDDAPLSARSKRRASAAKASASASHPPTLATTSALRVSHRDTKGIPPPQLETSEIKRFGKQPPPRKPTSSQPKSLSRKGAKIPYAPKSKTDWGDTRTIARALTQLHPLPHLLGNSAELAEEAAYGLAAAGDTGVDGRFAFYCHVTALLGKPIPPKLSVSELTDLLMRVLRTSQALYLDDAVPPAGRRYPLPPMGIGGHLTLDDVPISALSLPTLASTDPRMLTRYYTSHGIICDYLDFSRLPPDVFTSTKAYSDEAWYETVLRAHRFVSELFLMGGAHSRPQPPALCVILVAYTSSHMPVSSIHPDDAALFLRGLFPGRFATNDAAASFLRGLVVFAHFYNFVCEDFLYRFFPGLLLGIFEFWMEENFAQEFELDRLVRYTTAGDQYDDQVQTVIARARVLGKDYMPLDRMIFNEDNEHAMLHLGGHYPSLLVMFPAYYEAMQGVKVQMFLTFFYLTHPPDLLALDFYIYMACHGGLYPDPAGAPPLVSSISTLLAPCANHAWSLLKVRTPAPPTFLLGNAPRPALHDAAAFSVYIGEMAKVQLTDSDRTDAYERFEARDFIEPPLLSEHSFDVADGPIDTSPASSRKFISPQPFSHPCFAAIQGVKEWRSDPTVSAFINMPATSSTAVTMDTYAIYRIIHRTDPIAHQPLPVTEAAARFHAGVQQHLSAQPQVDFRLPAAWTAQPPAPRREPVVIDITAQEDAQRADLSSPTPLDRQASPSAIGWELDHAPSQHHHFTDDTFAFSADSGSDPEQGVDAPYPAPAFNAAGNPMSMTSGGQFVTRCARGLTSHSTISSNIVPDLYPVPLDCLLPRVQPPIYGCTSAASIHALPPHIKFNLTAPQVQQLYSVGINPYPVGGWRNPGPGALPDTLYDSDDPRLLRFQQEVHQRLEASGTAVSAATELRYTIPTAPTLVQAPATTSTIEPALSASLIGQPTLATAQSTSRAAAPTPTAPSGRPFVPPVPRQPCAQGPSSTADSARARASNRPTPGAPQPTFTTHGHPAAQRPPPFPLFDSEEGYWDGSTEYVPDDFWSPHAPTAPAPPARRVHSTHSSARHAQTGADAEGDGHAYPTRDQAFDDFLPVFHGRTDATSATSARSRTTAPRISSSAPPLATRMLPTLPPVGAVGRGAPSAPASGIPLSTRMGAPASGLSSPSLYSTHFRHGMRLVACTGQHLLALRPQTPQAQAIASGLRARLFPTQPPVRSSVLLLQTQPDTPLPDRSLGLTYPILINSYAVAEYVVVSVTPEVAPIPYVTAGSRGGILLANPSLLCASTEVPWPAQLTIPLLSLEHPCLLGYDAPFRPSFTGPDPRSASDPSGPYVPIAKRKAAPSPAPSSDSSATSVPHCPPPPRDRNSKPSYRAHKHRRRANSESSHSSDTSGSSERGTRTLTDVAGREVLRGSGTTQQLVRMTDQVRTLAPDVHIARILQGPGKHINQYTVANLCRGAIDYYIIAQQDDGPNVRDPSFYQTPPMVTCLWYVQRESNPSVALKACLFIFALSRNWQPDSLRLFHFLPEGRAAALASARFKGTWQDWIDALRGLAATYSALFDTSYGTAFLDMVNHRHRQRK
ncbi:hypothetical protein B484DRAFT_470358, partial [Ochromonadaceae sp. CCMP2298]